jgi:hypothetical protein
VSVPEGGWGNWRLETKNGENGVHWVEAFKPLYIAGSTSQKLYKAASGLLGRMNPFHQKRDKSKGPVET